MTGHRGRRSRASWSREWAALTEEVTDAWAIFLDWVLLWSVGTLLAAQSVIDEWRPHKGRHRGHNRYDTDPILLARAARKQAAIAPQVEPEPTTLPIPILLDDYRPIVHQEIAAPLFFDDTPEEVEWGRIA